MPHKTQNQAMKACTIFNDILWAKPPF